ncbi:MAG: M10 family metallopeptidase C-terminal domain-containing protein, partial [Methylococcales bacterium]|nr:M10 family metallopeptidase C-terminal domain-containing protein [Methylococcales bacterium]
LGIQGDNTAVLLRDFEVLKISAGRLFIQSGNLTTNPYEGQTRYGLIGLEFVTGSEIVQLTNLDASTYELLSHVNVIPSGMVSISGNLTQNQILTANNTLSDIDGLGDISYQWFSSNLAITGANQFTYTLTQIDVGKLITVIASYTDLFGTVESVSSSVTATVANINDLPTGSVSISGTSTQGHQLTASNSLADADGMGTVSYTWYASGSALSIGTGNTFTLTQAEVGKTISAVASYTDLLGTPESVTSLVTGTVANVNDQPTGTVSISSTATQGQQLTASNNLVDADGMGTVTYTWYASGSATPIGNGSTYALTQAEVGKTISAVASYTDLLGTPETVTSLATVSIANINDLPTGSVSISGDLIQGQQLTATNDIIDADGLGTLTYSWYASGSATPIGIGNTYTLTQSEVGKTISVIARYTDLLGTTETVASISTSSIENINDLPTGSVSISGTIAQGWQLTASNTIKDTDGLGDITYNWYASGSAAVIGTGNTYILKKADAGKTITARASYLDGQGTSESVTSSPTSQVLTSIINGKLGNDSLLGTLGDDQISGLKGNDILDGGLGIDTLIGGLGNDTYIVDSTTDTITELVNQGTDTVKTSVNFSLENISHVENLMLVATDPINGTGNSLKNVITGNSNSNQLDGGLGNDTLVGGFGDDTYVVDSLSDVVTEKALQGNDTIVTSNLKTYSLSKLGNVENLIYTGSESAKLTGNGLDNSLMGSILNDTLIGGLGNDTLTGGTGADHFVFNTKLNGTSNVDKIKDFESGIDKIDLSKAIFKTVGAKGVLSADAFNSGDFIGGQNPTDRIIYNTTTGALYYDVDGSGTKSSVQIAVIGIDSHANLTNTDFLITA